MSFNSIQFVLLFFATFLLYFLLPQKLRNYLLLLASYVFYAAYDLKLSLYLVLTTAITYGIGRSIEQNLEGKTAKRRLVLGISLNAGALGFYKYFAFFASNILRLANSSKTVTVSWAVPLGISFIVFSAISYLVDIYRKKIPAERNILKFALFLSFFPKLIQGPLEKAGDILPQFDEKHTFDVVRFRKGAVLMLYGLFMKMVVADLAGIIVDSIYGNLQDHSGAAILTATVLFAIQLYCDFAGYSYTAIGAAKILGFRFKPNFTQPYLSLSVGEFWRRWHMSLNIWLRDYIYIPLGGNRCSTARKNFNVLVTFGVSGLWHGANWGYLIWGLLNGFYVVVESTIKKIYAKHYGRKAAEKRAGDAVLNINEPETVKTNRSAVSVRLGKMLHGALTCVLVGFSWIFFHGISLSGSFTALSRIFTRFDLLDFLRYVLGRLQGGAGTALYGVDVLFGLPFLIGGVLVVIIVDLLANKRDLPSVLAANRWLRWPVVLFLLFAIILFGVYGYGFGAGSFIYTGF